MAQAALCLITLSLFCSFGTAHELWIDQVTIISPERSHPLRNTTVVIRDEKIVSISTRITSKSAKNPKNNSVEIIDGQGLYLTPGLIDSHVHTAMVNGMTPEQEAAHPDIARAAREQIPRSYLYFGFTSLVDLDSSPEPISKWNRQPVRPDIYFCGATPILDGYPTVWMPKPQRYQVPYLLLQAGDTPPEGMDPAAHTPEALVARMKADGARCVKTFYEHESDGAQWPVPRADSIRALAKAAHAAGMPVFIHANSTQAQKFALEVGADIIAHGLWHWDGETEATELTPRVRQVLDGVLKNKIGWQATTQVGYGFRDQFNPNYLSDPQLARVLPTALIQWYGTTEGQTFRDRMASSFLPEYLRETKDAAARWVWVESFYRKSLAPL